MTSTENVVAQGQSRLPGSRDASRGGTRQNGLAGSVEDVRRSRGVGLAQALRHGLLLGGRNVAKTVRAPEQIGDFAIQPLIFVLMFVYLFGGAIAGDWRDYLQFVIPGIMVQTVLSGTMWTGMGINTDIQSGIFDRFRSLPIARSAPLFGAVLGDMVRYVVACVVVGGFGMLLGFRVQTNPAYALLAVLFVLGMAFAVSWVSVLLGVLARSPGSVGGFAFLVIMPLCFASSAFVDPDTMPSVLRGFVRNNPVSQLCDTVRGLLLDQPFGQHALVTVLWIAGFVAVFAPLAVRAFLRRA